MVKEGTSFNRFLVEVKRANLEQINLDGKTALHDAAQFSNFEIVDYLIKRGEFSFPNQCTLTYEFL
jgi:ankyrin repeat protein